ncbi:putative WRKY transcription factor 17-like, partial [Trifolium medium]|nr:putative WRKY transcription factor 17-like [Trifolium medium]
MEFHNKDTVLETAFESLNSLEKLTNVLTHQPSHLNFDLTKTTVSNFKKLSSLLNRTGHARFRRAPVVPQPPQTTLPPPPLHIQPQPPQPLTLDYIKPNILRSNPKSLSLELEFPKETFRVSSNSAFMPYAITGDSSVSNDRQGSSLFLTPTILFGGKPPLSSSSLKNKCHSHSD